MHVTVALERSLWASVFKYCFKIALEESSWTLNKSHYSEILNNGNHNSEPQYYHIKYIHVITMSAIVGMSFLSTSFNDFFKIALVLFL